MHNSLGYKLLHSYDHLRALTKLYEFCWGPFHEGPDMFSPFDNLKPYEHGAVLFTYSEYAQRFASYKRFPA